MKDNLSKSEVRRLKVVKGSNWWIDEDANPNGIGPICFFCKNLIDWGATDHTADCPVRMYIDMDKELPKWMP